jgi:hypothetical protein
MPEESEDKDPGAVWKSQPEENIPVKLDYLITRRTRELYSSTRSEIMISIGAAVLFAAVAAWRLAWARDRFVQFGLTAIVVWVLISLPWFRRRLRREESQASDALAVTGLEHYRKELEQRRDHLRNEWIWHGPLILACLTLVAVLIGRAFHGFQRLENILPLVILLGVWTGVGLRRRLRQAAELQREIDEISRVSSIDG